jgi:2-methylisocitrate lyase-like PEP mutase family enzyme
MSVLAAQFLAAHRRSDPLLMPNPWDIGSARLLASLGFEALATTSSGFAATLGRLDGGVTREEALAHAAELVAAVDVPVSADLENGFGDAPEAVAETVRGAIEVGLAGCSIEDWSGTEIYGPEAAVERVAAAAEAAGDAIVVTARAENYLRDRVDLDDTIARLVAFRDAGADCVYAPGLKAIEDIRAVVDAVGIPVNVLALPGAPTVAELAGSGVARVSVGGAFAFAAIGAVVEAATEFREQGTYGFWGRAGAGSKAARAAFG